MVRYGSGWRELEPHPVPVHTFAIAIGTGDLRPKASGVRLLEMLWNRRRRWALLAALRSSHDSEKRLISLKIKRLHRATAIRRHLQALRRKLTIKRMQLCMVLFALTLRSSQTIRSVWTLPRYLSYPFSACS